MSHQPFKVADLSSLSIHEVRPEFVPLFLGTPEARGPGMLAVASGHDKRGAILADAEIGRPVASIFQSADETSFGTLSSFVIATSASSSDMDWLRRELSLRIIAAKGDSAPEEVIHALEDGKPQKPPHGDDWIAALRPVLARSFGRDILAPPLA